MDELVKLANRFLALNLLIRKWDEPQIGNHILYRNFENDTEWKRNFE